jgi:hypothetical protein
VTVLKATNNKKDMGFEDTGRRTATARRFQAFERGSRFQKGATPSPLLPETEQGFEGDTRNE